MPHPEGAKATAAREAQRPLRNQENRIKLFLGGSPDLDGLLGHRVFHLEVV